MRVALGIAPEHGWVLFQHSHGQQEQVVEIEQPLFAALSLVSPEKLHACLHELRLLGIVGARSPRLQPLERDELLLHALEHLQHWRHQVIGPLVTGQRCVADLPHQLPGEDPSVGPGHDSEACRYADGAPVFPEPAHRDRVKGSNRRDGSFDQRLDALAHLVGGAVGEGHDQDRSWRDPLRHQAADALGDHGGFAGPSTGDHTDGSRAQCRGLSLFDP